MTEQPKSIPELLESDRTIATKLKDVTTLMQNMLREGTVYYSRGELKNQGYDFRQEGDKVIVQAPTMEQAGHGAYSSVATGDSRESLRISGTCRDIAPAIGVTLKTTGAISGSEVLACYQGEHPDNGLSPNEYHYVALGTVQGDSGEVKIIVDLGYNQPIPVPVVVGGGPVVSNFYSENQNLGFYGGEVVYKAVDTGDGSVILIIGTKENPAQYKRFQFWPTNHRPGGPTNPTVDEMIVAQFGRLTGKNYRTGMTPGEGGQVMTKANLEGPNMLGELHTLIGEIGENVRITTQIGK